MKSPTDTLLDHAVSSAADRDRSRRRIAMADGAAAELEGNAPMESLRFFAPGGDLLFEYDARTGKARVSVCAGELEVATGPGDLVLKGDRRVRIEGESVEIAGRAGVTLATSRAPGAEGAEVSLKGDALSMIAADLALTAARGDFRIGETRFLGEMVRGWVADARLTLQRIETLAATVVRKARDVYDTVEGLTQLRTGRLRTLVKGTWRARSRDTVLTAERDFDIDGEEIHLG